MVGELNRPAPACPLCGGAEPCLFYHEAKHAGGPGRCYHRCPECDLVFLDPADRLSRGDEMARYLLHENDVDDPGYQEYLRPLCDEILRRAAPGSQGLDFGAGPAPALAAMLGRAGREVALYDPFFHPEPGTLERQYDFVAASEVVEHFHDPAAEFGRLRRLLKPGGFLAVMTLLVDPSIDFAGWHYRRDPTHVAFYSKRAFEWLARRHAFRLIDFCAPRVVVLTA